MNKRGRFSKSAGFLLGWVLAAAAGGCDNGVIFNAPEPPVFGEGASCRAAVLSPAVVRVSWDSVPGAAAYKLYRTDRALPPPPDSMPGPGDYAEIPMSVSPDPPFYHYDDTVAVSREYFYKVAVVYSGGEEILSDYCSVKTPADMAGMAPPTGLRGRSVRDGADIKIGLKWNLLDIPGVTYQISRIPAGSVSVPASIDPDAEYYCYDTTPPTLGVTYTYTVSAAVSGFSTPPSAELEIVNIPDPQVDLAPDLDFDPPRAGVTILWNGYTGAGYEIYRSSGPDVFPNSPVTPAIPGDPAGNNYFDDQVGAGTYYYKVRAKVGAAYNAYSQVTAPVEIPAAPAGVTISTVPSLSISWTPVSGADGQEVDGYEVQWSLDADFSSIASYAGPYTSPFIHSPGTGIWYYRVRARKGNYFGAYSSPAGPVTLP